MPYKRNLSVSIIPIASIVLIAACSPSTSPANTPTPATISGEVEVEPTATETETTLSTGACANSYFPVSLGASWTYTATGSDIGTYTFTDSISEVRPDGFSLTAQFTDIARTQEWECKPDGLTALELGGGVAASVTTGDSETTLQTSNILGVTVPATITPGQEWTHSMDVAGELTIGSDMVGSAEGQATTDFRAIGLETVTVPAGTFEAMRIDSDFTLKLEVTVEGVTLPMTVTSLASSWYAPGVGWVKSESTGTVFEITSSLETIELTDFSVP